jgi:hypothetical protein
VCVSEDFQSHTPAANCWTEPYKLNIVAKKNNKKSNLKEITTSNEEF